MADFPDAAGGHNFYERGRLGLPDYLRDGLTDVYQHDSLRTHTQGPELFVGTAGYVLHVWMGAVCDAEDLQTDLRRMQAEGEQFSWSSISPDQFKEPEAGE